jgi:hypothetical protein
MRDTWPTHASPFDLSRQLHLLKNANDACPHYVIYSMNINSVALVRKRTLTIERPPHVGEVSAKFADRGCSVVSATEPHGR